MTSKASPRFWACLNALPPSVQALAKSKYDIWRRDPFHPSLHFKELAPGLWSARINLQYRALARRRGELVAWFWIGTHEEYDRLIPRG